MIHVTSSDGTQLVVHDFGGDGPPLLLSHATGFHARCYARVARALADRFHCFGVDYRGHGCTKVAGEWFGAWTPFGDDTVAVARSIAPDGGVVGFGHSMGASALLMAARHEPELFDRLVLFEPIANPGVDLPVDMDSLPIVQGARRRRRLFASKAEAFENYRGKPPMSIMEIDVLRDYVEYGFRDAVGPDGEPAVELRCPPELEAAIFVGGFSNGVWEILPEVTTPTLVLGGAVEDSQPSSRAESTAKLLPNGRYLRIEHLTHFGPFSHPNEIAAIIAENS